MKPWYASRTLWFNVICAIAGALEASTAMVRETLLADQSAVWGAYSLIVTIGNAVLRAMTTEPLCIRGDR